MLLQTHRSLCLRPCVCVCVRTTTFELLWLMA